MGIRSRMEVFWIPLVLVQSAYLVSSQEQAILPVNSSTELQRCGTTTTCSTFFQSSIENFSLRGFCGLQFFDDGKCSRVDSDGNALCKETVGAGCTCCPECLEKDCSSKGEGWGCYSEEAAASFPQGSCLYDGSCRGTPGSPYGMECACCKKQIDPPPCVQSTKCQDSFDGQNGIRGFCGDRSWRGGDCFTNGPDEKPACPSLDANACTCCKECLDTTCSSKGKQWSCFSREEASLLPKGACVFDNSCPRTPNSPYEDSSCACCDTEYVPPCDQTEKCREAFPETGVKGFCSKGQLSGVDCLPLDGIGQSFCNFTSCSCCKECFDKNCSDKGEGWSCYSKDEAYALPQGSCVFDDSCAKSPGSPYDGACACCKKDVTVSPPPTTPTPPCDTTFQCKSAYPGTGLRGFWGIKVSLAETVPVRTYLAVSQFVTERVVRAVRSVSTKSVHPRERAGAATTERQQLLYPRVHVSLIALALVLLAPPTKILHVHAANQRSHLSPVKTKDVPKSGTDWGPVLMCPTQTGNRWMLAST